MVTGALWAHAQPSAAMLAAYEADPSLAAFRLDFAHDLYRGARRCRSAGRCSLRPS